MKKLYLLFTIILAFIAVSLIYFVSSSNSSIEATHKVLNGDLKFYSADLDHDGVIGANERNLTWKESYDKLLAQSNDFKELEKIADAMKIDKSLDNDTRINLARNEILHQAEDLLLSTHAIIPLHNGMVTYLVQDYLEGAEHNVYHNIVFDNAFINEKKAPNHKKKQEVVVVAGPEPRLLDPCLISEVYGATVAENCLRSISFRPKGSEIKNDLGIAVMRFDKNTKTTIFDIYIGNFELKSGKKGNSFSDYNFISDVYWDDGKKIVAEDLLWTINRAASPVTGSPFPFFLENIVGYKEWCESEKERIKKSGEFNKTYSFYKGMKGVKLTTNKEKNIESLEVRLVNNPYIFKEGLSNVNLAFSPRHRMTKNTGTPNEEIVSDWWCYTKDNAKDKQYYFCCNGPFKAKKIDVQKNGSVVLEKNDKYALKDKIKLEKVTFNFRNDEETVKTDFFNKKVDLNDMLSRSQIPMDSEGKIPDDFNKFLKKESLPIGSYLIFNVNDDALDAVVHKDDDPCTAEEKRQKARAIVSLLIDRDYICNVINKGFSVPARCIVPTDIKENVIPKRNNDGTITVDKKKKDIDWCLRGSYVPGEYNRFEKRNLDEGSFISIYTGSTKEKDYKDKIAKIKKRNMEKVISLADELNLEYDLDKNGIIKFRNFPKISVIISSGRATVLEHIQDYLGKHGITFNLSQREFNYLLTLGETGDFCMYTIAYSADFCMPDSFLTLFTSDSINDFCQLGKNKTSIHRSYNKRNSSNVVGICNKKKKKNK